MADDVTGAVAGLLGTAIMVDVAGKVINKTQRKAMPMRKLKHKGGVKWIK